MTSSIARSVARTKPATASCLLLTVSKEPIRPGPGSGVTSSTCRTNVGVPLRSSWIGSLFTKPVAASTAPWATAAPCPKSGYSTIVTSSVLSLTEARRAWSMIHDEPYLPGMPIFLPLRSEAVLIPDDALPKTIDGNWR